MLFACHVVNLSSVNNSNSTVCLFHTRVLGRHVFDFAGGTVTPPTQVTLHLRRLVVNMSNANEWLPKNGAQKNMEGNTHALVGKQRRRKRLATLTFPGIEGNTHLKNRPAVPKAYILLTMQGPGMSFARAVAGRIRLDREKTLFVMVFQATSLSESTGQSERQLCGLCASSYKVAFNGRVSAATILN